MFKAIIKSMWSKKISVLFIIIQLSVTIFMIFNLLTNFNVFSQQKSEISEILGENKDKVLQIIFNDLYPTEAFSEKAYELEEYTKSIDGVEDSGGFFDTGYVFNELKNNVEYINIVSNLYKGTIKEQSLSQTDCILIDKNINSLMNLKVTEGRNFNKEDFNLASDDLIPVIVGAKFKTAVNIGDIISTNEVSCDNKTIRYTVVGFLEANSSWISGSSDYISNIPTNLDEYFIMPFNKDMQKSMLVVTAKSTSYFLCVNEKYDVDKVKAKIYKKSKELGLNNECYTVDESLEEYKKEHIDAYKSIIITTSIAIVISIFTITATILASIQKRKREIGIRIVTGASISYIRKLFLGEIICITCVSAIIAVSYITYEKYEYYTDFLMSSFNISQVLNEKSIFLLVCLIFVIVLISSYIPLRKLKKLQPKELIGGIE